MSLSELRRAVADKLTRVSMGYLTDTHRAA